MMEELKELQEDSVVFFTNEEAVELFDGEEMRVTGVKVYSTDDGEMVVVEMDEFYLVAHNFQSEEAYYVYRLVDSGEDLEDEGYKFLKDDGDFCQRIAIRNEEGKAQVYHHSDVGPLYGVTRDDAEVSLCEFQSNSADLTHILIEKDDDGASIMQGFEISEDDFQFSE